MTNGIGKKEKPGKEFPEQKPSPTERTPETSKQTETAETNQR